MLSRSRAAEQLVDRHAQGLGFDVPQCELDAGDGFVRDAAEVLARSAQHVPVELLDRARVLADEQRLEIAHAAGHAVRIAAVAALAPADQARRRSRL